MDLSPLELTLEVQPRSRFDIIDVTQKIHERVGDQFYQHPKAFYCSFHTTAGYFEQSLCARLKHSREHVHPFLRAFQKLFPPGAEYYHDQLQLRRELTEEQRKYEPKNADSHLIFISSGLRNCVTYNNQRGVPVYFIDLDGVNGESRRQRKTTIVAFREEEIVHRAVLQVPVSRHPIDSINLRDNRIGIIDEVNDLIRRYDIQKGKVDIALAPTESHAGLTVNEYETLLMKHDLAEVLRNPFKFMAQKGKHMLEDPRAIPSKTLNYAKYDLVHFFNELMDAFHISESMLEKILSKFIAVPAERFLRMKRKVSLYVSDQNPSGTGQIVHGTYQSPILVQWKAAANRTRHLTITLTRFK